MKKTISEFGIIVELFQVPETESTKLHGVISSKLKEHLVGNDPTNDPELLAVINTIESLVLGHACAGIDVSSPAYVEGLRSSLEAIANHY
jgi:hypothetical protein